jgi:tetrahydromethanopterin S-methyltransferase subunit F
MLERIAREPVRVAALAVGILQAAVLMGWLTLSDAQIDGLQVGLLAAINLLAILSGAEAARAKVTPVHGDQ